MIFTERARLSGVDYAGLSSKEISAALNKAAAEGNLKALELHVLKGYAKSTPDWLLVNAIKNRLHVPESRACELVQAFKANHDQAI